MSAVRRGIALTPMETREDIIVRTALLADELGYEAFALPEAWSLDSTIMLTRIGLQTRRITLVAGVLSVWGRTPATLAMTAATLHRLTEGRFVLGLGTSTAALAEGFHRTPFERPAARLREVTREVRHLLNGGRAQYDVPGQAHELIARPLALGLPAIPELPIWLGAIGDRTVEVTSDLADGWFPACQTRLGLAERAWQFSRPITVAAGPLTVAAADPKTARTAVSSGIVWYLCAMGTHYSAAVVRQGHGDAVQAIHAANPSPSPFSGIVPERAQALIDELTVSGTPDQVRAGLAAWDEVADIVMFGLPPGLPWHQIEATVRAAAPAATIPTTLTGVSYDEGLRRIGDSRRSNPVF
ncbi:LLM class flavin-dependent oxidoreductase [Kribbella sp. NBC_01505]|uniref:LLM class flavin-dependent oxidoreductase n=1 Tax=Kribbella sp. NBC_01505 TaxID=2903580 RepID=UPI00386884A0